MNSFAGARYAAGAVRTAVDEPVNWRLTARGVLLAVAVALCVVYSAIAQRAQVAPEAATGRMEKPLSFAERHMVVAAHPIAAEAGREILRRGGNALDAAIATVLVLGIVEPQQWQIASCAMVCGEGFGKR